MTSVQIIERLMSVAGVGGFMAFMMWIFMKTYMKQMREQIAGIAKARDEERAQFLKLIDGLKSQNATTEERLFELAQKQTEYIANTAIALTKIADSMQADRFCPFGKTRQVEAENAEQGG